MRDPLTGQRPNVALLILRKELEEWEKFRVDKIKEMEELADKLRAANEAIEDIKKLAGWR